MTRQAISPRLAIKTLDIAGGGSGSVRSAWLLLLLLLLTHRQPSPRRCDDKATHDRRGKGNPRFVEEAILIIIFIGSKKEKHSRLILVCVTREGYRNGIIQ